MTAFAFHRALTVATAACIVSAAGCGQHRSAPATADGAATAALPRQIVLPDRVTALPARSDDACGIGAQASAAGFEQPGGVAARIRGLSAAPEAESPALIREPGKDTPLLTAVSEPVAPPSDLRSPYVPVETPPEPARPPVTALPELPPRPALADDSLRTPRAEHMGSSQPAYQPLPAVPQVLSPQALAPPFTAPAAPSADHAAMLPVSQRALEISNHAYGLAQRGMLYAARAELIQSLQLVAQALDVQRGTSAHASALASGLQALEEAQDFAPAPGRHAPLNVAEITRAHQTPVLKEAEDLSPVIAQQQYLAYAQSQLALATGNEAVASLTLFRLGKLQMAMAQHDADPQMLHGPQAMVFYQAALAADDRNYLAANELGVLMARYGQLQEARRLLVHSVSIQPHVEAWHNLSVVHQRLGETDLATRAAHERELLAQRSPSTSLASGNVQWVDAKTFAANSGGEVPWEGDAQTASRATVRGSASLGQTR